MNRRPRLRFHLVALAAGLAAMLAGCGVVNPHAAVVNGTTIAESELQAELEAIRRNDDYVTGLESGGGVVFRGQSRSRFDLAFVTRVLTRQIYLQLVHEEAARRGVEPTGAEREAARISVERDVGGPDVFQRFPQSYRETLIRRAAHVAALQRDISGFQFDEAAQREYYEENQAQFVETCSAHMLFAVTDPETGRVDPEATAAQSDELRAQAEVVRQEIAEGKAFAEALEERQAEHPEGAGGDELGCAPPGQFIAEFEDAVGQLEPGEVSQPVQTQFGWHLITVTERRPQPFEEVQDQIIQALEGAGQAEFAGFLQEAVTEADVEVNPRYGSFVVDGNQALVVPPDQPPAEATDEEPLSPLVVPR